MAVVGEWILGGKMKGFGEAASEVQAGERVACPSVRVLYPKVLASGCTLKGCFQPFGPGMPQESRTMLTTSASPSIPQGLAGGDVSSSYF